MEARLRLKIYLLVGLILIVLSYFAIFIPSQTKSTQIEWQPKSSVDSGSFFLFRGWPNSLSISIDTSKLGQRDQLLLDIGNWKLRSAKNFIFLLNKEKLLIQYNIPPTNRFLELTFDSNFKRLELGNDNYTILDDKDFPLIQKFFVPDSADFAISKVQIETRPSQISNSKRAPYLCGLLLLWLVFLFQIHGLKLKFGRFFLVLIRSYRDGMSMQLPLFFAAIFLPAWPDDGWVLTRTSFFAERGFLGNVFTAQDAALPQGFLPEFLYAHLVDMGFSLFHFRILISIVLTIAWGYFSRSLVQIAAHQKNPTSLFVASVYLVFACSFLMTVRAEIWVFLISLVALSILNSNLKELRLRTFFLTLFFMLALSIHQTGYVLLGPLVTLTVTSVRSKRDILEWISGFLIGFHIGIILFFIGLDPLQLIEGANDFRTAGSHSQNEIDRYIQVFRYTSELRVFSVLLFLSLIMFCCIFLLDDRLKRMKPINHLFLSSLISPIFLIFTSSKWAWHFGSITLSVVYLAYILSSRVFQNSYTYLYLVISVLGLIYFLSMNFSGPWGHLDYGTFAWSSFGNFFQKPFVFLVQILVYFFIVSLIVFYKGKRNSYLIGRLVSILILIPLILNFFWMAVDAGRQYEKSHERLPGWSPGYQNLRLIFGEDKCGILNSMKSVGEFSPLESVDNSNSKSFDSSVNYSSLDLDSIESLVIVKDLFGKNYDSNFELDNQSEIGVWYNWNGSSASIVYAEFISTDGKLIKRMPIVANTPGVFNWVTLDVPSGASKVNLTGINALPVGDYVTRPVKFKPLQSTIKSEYLHGFTSPYISTYLPCLKNSNPKFGFVKSAHIFIPGIYQTENSKLAQIACLSQQNFCLYSVKFTLPKNLNYKFVSG